MSWIILSLAAAFLTGFKDLYTKKLTKGLDEYLLAFFPAVIIFICLLPVVLITGTPELGDNFLMALLITGVANAITLVLIYKAIKTTDLSLVTPLFSLSPLLILITSPFIVGEVPSIIGLIGVFLILGGTYALNFDGKINLKPLTHIITNKGQRLVLIAAIIWAFSSNYYKIGMEESSPFFFILAINLVIATLLLPIMIKGRYFAKINGNFVPLSILGLLYGTATIFQWVAVSMSLIVYVLSIKRLGVLVSVIGAHFLFNEKNTLQRTVAAVIIILGVIVITFA